MKFSSSVGSLSRRRFLKHLAWIAPAAVVADAMVWEPDWLSIQTQRIPSSFGAARFVHITDIHFKGKAAYLHKVISTINQLQPEFVCFTGDLIEKAEFLEPAVEILRELKAPLYGIPGNHDHWSRANLTPFINVCRKSGGDWLLDRCVPIAKSQIQIMGIDHLNARIRTRTETFNLLLMHYPGWADDLPYRCDLLLAGHTHGGQVRFPFCGPIILPEGSGSYDRGMFQTQAGPLYVNPGIGTFYHDVRFRCRPEITVFEVGTPV